MLEKEHEPGGHARSVVVDGYVFDFGPHILFSNDPAMEALIRDLLGENMRAQERQAFIYHAAHDLYTRFPFQAHLYGLPVELVRECLVGLVDAVERRARNGFEPANYEQWMRAMFGDGIADRLMIPVRAKDLDGRAVGDGLQLDRPRVPTPDVERIVTGALTDDVAQVGATSHFWYPWHGGIASLGSALAERVTGIELGARWPRSISARRVVRLADGDELAFDELILTLPLCFLPRWFDDMPPSQWPTRAPASSIRGIFNVNVGVDRPVLSDKHWIYFYEDEFPYHRLSFPGNFSPRNVPDGKSSVSTEVAYSRHRPLDRDTMVERTLASLSVRRNPRPRRRDRARPRRGDPPGLRDLRPCTRPKRRDDTRVAPGAPDLDGRSVRRVAVLQHGPLDGERKAGRRGHPRRIGHSGRGHLE